MNISPSQFKIRFVDSICCLSELQYGVSIYVFVTDSLYMYKYRYIIGATVQWPVSAAIIEQGTFEMLHKKQLDTWTTCLCRHFWQLASSR